MKRILKKYRLPLQGVIVFALLLLASVVTVSCDKQELEIQHDFPFEIDVMPVPKEVFNGQTVEIRITIQRSGKYQNTQYYLRYFQFDGKGTLRYYDNPPYLPNDLYHLEKEQFRLYYTSKSTVSQSFDVWISDNFGNEKKVSFKFNSND